MGEKAEYKSAIRSRKLIRQAYIELMQEKDLDKITVTDIITRADINRGTFYAHYENTHAVIAQIGNEIIDKMLIFFSEFTCKNFLENPMPLLQKFSGWLKEDLEFYQILINSRGAEQFFVKLKNTFVEYLKTNCNIPNNIKQSPEFFIRAHFIAGGVCNLVQVWFRGEFTSSIDEICLEIGNIIRNNSELFGYKVLSSEVNTIIK